ncbi:MAG: hypothetical protein JAZ03_23165, partial [Candidatus Thiodiazotropha taylori]|nr:hypothetical protein [Candidatus Thiodiazotropha taylori]MCW4336832.1 hypothetical protein [Candidatus Thiodiazotropha endolucinida]
ETTGLAIARQKKIHDKRLSYEGFKVGDRVLVYFPVKKSGQSPKLSLFWRGPFEVIDIISEVLLDINCARNGGIQTIHIDRVRKVRNQTLFGESENRLTSEQVDSQEDVQGPLNEQPELSEEADKEESLVETRSKRVVRKPKWLRDYLSVFSICRDMPATKQTPRKRSMCPTCKTDIKWEDYLDHVKQCGKPSKPEKKLACSICNSLFSKKANLNKHVKKFHPVSATCTSTSELDSKENKREKVRAQTETDDWDKDPEIELDYTISSSSSSDEDKSEDSDQVESCDEAHAEPEKNISEGELTIGRTQRKPCTPQPVRAPLKKKLEIQRESTTVKKPKVIQKDSGAVAKDLKGVNVSFKETHDKEVQVSPTFRCEHCQITFDDEIVYAIHRGWHSLRHPFQCNLCGELCHNKYQFYSHLGRSHTA